MSTLKDRTSALRVTEDDVTQKLRLARNLLAGGWCRFNRALNAQGHSVDENDATATQFCVMGVLERVGLDGYRFNNAAMGGTPNEALTRLGFGGGGGRNEQGYRAVSWNNDGKTTQADVLARFDAAIAGYGAL